MRKKTLQVVFSKHILRILKIVSKVKNEFAF